MCASPILPLLVTDAFRCSYSEPTVFENYVHSLRPDADGPTVELSLWDTAGQEEFDRLRSLSYADTHAVMLCFAVNNPVSLENVESRVSFPAPLAPQALVLISCSPSPAVVARDSRELSWCHCGPRCAQMRSPRLPLNIDRQREGALPSRPNLRTWSADSQKNKGDAICRMLSQNESRRRPSLPRNCQSRTSV